MALSVSQVWVYPVKSCAGIPLDRAVTTKTGFLLDRNWTVVKETGRFLTQRQEPRLALVHPRIEPAGILTGEVDLASAKGAALVLSSPGHPELAIPLHKKRREELDIAVWDWKGLAGDEGDAAGRWLSDVVGVRGLRLARYIGAPGVSSPEADPARRVVEPEWTPEGTETAFSDGYPYLVVNEASLGAVNAGILERAQRTGAGGPAAGGDDGVPSAAAEAPLPSAPASALPMNRFRPNVVVRGAAPWAEDSWGVLLAGGARLDLLKPCGRCRLTTVDQATAVRDPSDDPEPLATLGELRKGELLGFVEPRDHRKEVFFGWNAISRAVPGADRPGIVAVGDAVDVVEERDGASVVPKKKEPRVAPAQASRSASRRSALDRAPPDVFSLKTLAVVLLMLLAGLILANLSPRKGRASVPEAERVGVL